MHPAPVPFARISHVVLLLLILAALASAQESNVPPLIVQAVDDSQLTTLKGNTHPLARAQFDRGAAPPDLPMRRMLLVLKRSDEQESALRKLLDDQQDKASPNYHKWLTPEQFGRQFGPADQDLQAVTSWLQMHGFQVSQVTKGRTVIEFSGTAAQVQEALHSSIHKYLVDGEEHWANASDPQIPAALTPVVAGVNTLHNFLKKPMIRVGPRVPVTIKPGSPPQVTFPAQNGFPTLHALGPQDYAVIYNINPAYQAGIDGSGTTIAVVGRSNINVQDVTDFRNAFGLSFNPPQVIIDGPDPGDLGGGEEFEAVLDNTWSGALAPNSNVKFVVSAITNTTDGVDLSEVYIVDNNLADIMTESFGSCEAAHTSAEISAAGALAEQAAAQGITYTVSSGDTGAEGCDNLSEIVATGAVSVNFLASTPFNVAVGGTIFNEGTQSGKYWSSSLPLAETALSYIPENVWNESCTVSQCGSQNANIAAGGGGASSFFSKPSWQSGVSGIPTDGKRDMPDVSLTAALHDPYLVCFEFSCEQNFIYLVGGTSASSPSFAGIMALVDQKMGSRQGQANYVLYRLAAAETLSQCNASNTTTLPAASCVFNDVTKGNNVVPGEIGTQYQSGVGYDLASGLGSVNVSNLVNNWNTVIFRPTSTTLNLSPTTNISHGQSVTVTASVTPNSGTGTPTGDVSLTAQTGSSSSGQTLVDSFSLTSGSINLPTHLLPGGTNYTVTAHYAGDATFGGSDSGPVTVTVLPESSTTTTSVLAFDLGGNSLPLSNVPYGNFVYLRADVAGSSGQGFPSGSVNFNDSAGSVPGNPFVLNSEGNTATPNFVLTLPAGQNSISASYGGDASFKPSSSTAVSVTIAKGSTATVLTSSSSSVGQGSSVTLTATVNTNSLGDAPGGTVTFFSGTTQLGSAPAFGGFNSRTGIVNATASLTTSQLPNGQDSITAQYGGDQNYSVSTSAAITVTVQPDFAFSGSAPSISTSPGGSGTLTLTITGQTGYNSTISFTSASCAGLPRKSKCGFNPPSVAGSGTTTLTVTTTAPTAAALNGSGWWATGAGFTVAAVFLCGIPRKRRWSAVASFIVTAFLMTGVGCGGGGGGGGGGGDPGTPRGSYTVVVTATGGALSHTVNFTLNVQ